MLLYVRIVLRASRYTRGVLARHHIINVYGVVLSTFCSYTLFCFCTFYWPLPPVQEVKEVKANKWCVVLGLTSHRLFLPKLNFGVEIATVLCIDNEKMFIQFLSIVFKNVALVFFVSLWLNLGFLTILNCF